MKTFFILPFLFCIAAAFAQPTRLELGMKRNTAQTLMGTAKIDRYERAKTIYTYPQEVFFIIEFDAEELCTGFFWSGKDEAPLIKTIEENGFSKRDSATYFAKDLAGVLKKETTDSEIIFRFVAAVQPIVQQEKKPVKTVEETPKEKPFYGFTILGATVWKVKERHELH